MHMPKVKSLTRTVSALWWRVEAEMMYLARLLLTQLTLTKISRKYLQEQKFQWVGNTTFSKAGCGATGSLVATVPGRYIPVYNLRLCLHRRVLLFITQWVSHFHRKVIVLKKKKKSQSDTLGKTVSSGNIVIISFSLFFSILLCWKPYLG